MVSEKNRKRQNKVEYKLHNRVHIVIYIYNIKFEFYTYRRKLHLRINTTVLIIINRFQTLTRLRTSWTATSNFWNGPAYRPRTTAAAAHPLTACWTGHRHPLPTHQRNPVTTTDWCTFTRPARRVCQKPQSLPTLGEFWMSKTICYRRCIQD